MRNTLSPSQIDQYRQNGFLVIEDFLDASELANWKAQVQEAVRQRLDSDFGLHNQSDSKSYYSRVFTQCLKLAESHAGVHDLMHDARLGEMAGTLAGVDGIRIWHDQALIKPPYGNPTAWHLDNPYWSFSSPNALSLWVALDDATLANGCLWYLPGTHRSGVDLNADIGNELDALFTSYPDWLKIDPVATPCKAGSAVWHNGLTAHGAGANMTNKPRSAMTCAYMPDGSVFNGIKNVLPDEYFNSLTIGDVLDSDAVNPLIWKNSK